MTEIFNLQNIIYILLGLTLLSICLLIWNIKLELKIKRILRGKKNADMEESFFTMQKELDDFAHFRTEIEKYLINIEKRLSTSVRGVSNLSFSAFAGLESGGKSFATALLNEKGDGIILSSLHARDRVSIFTKTIKNYKSDIELSEEEQNALTKAKESCIV